MSREFAGTLRERVAIGTAGVGDDAGAAGDPVFGAPLWASVEAEKPLPGNAGERLAAPARYLIAMRETRAPRVPHADSDRHQRPQNQEIQSWQPKRAAHSC